LQKGFLVSVQTANNNNWLFVPQKLLNTIPRSNDSKGIKAESDKKTKLKYLGRRERIGWVLWKEGIIAHATRVLKSHSVPPHRTSFAVVEVLNPRPPR
jgi:hypothetical protein